MKNLKQKKIQNNKSGVYTITNTANNKIYVGCAEDIFDRKSKHFSALRKNKHINNYLQNSWNKYGEQKFVFEVLEECSTQIMYSLEHYWATILNAHNMEYGYNIKPTHPDNKTLRTKEMSDKIVKTRRSRGGYSWTEEQRIEHSATMSRVSPKRPIIMLDLRGNILEEFEGLRDCERKTGIGSNNICGVLKKKKHSAKERLFIYKEDFDKTKDYSYKRHKNCINSYGQSE